MGEGEIIKVTSKGQVTLPAKIRRRLALRDSSHLYVVQTGDLIVMKKVDDLSLDDISTILESLAKEKGITGEMLEQEIEAARDHLMAERRVEA
jgi:AbrB family looped-hinge helix DNA binding protein